jgi:hypothetical protein
MPLKLKKSQTPSEYTDRKNETEGSWGRINPERESVVALRLCRNSSAATEETHSYPYRVLASWRWNSGGTGEEELNIDAGTDVITVRGRGLDRIVDALDNGLLAVLHECSDDCVESPIWISHLQVSQREN